MTGSCSATTFLLSLQAPPAPEASSLQALLDDLFSQVNQQQQQQGTTNNSSSSSPVCVSTGGIEVLPARVAASPGPMSLRFSATATARAAAAGAAQQAAQQAAVLNADAGRAELYGGAQVSWCCAMRKGSTIFSSSAMDQQIKWSPILRQRQTGYDHVRNHAWLLAYHVSFGKYNGAFLL